ncbi:MAG: hypothetical protein AAGN66_06935 [Acidobacteriota bacterium]
MKWSLSSVKDEVPWKVHLWLRLSMALTFGLFGPFLAIIVFFHDDDFLSRTAGALLTYLILLFFFVVFPRDSSKKIASAESSEAALREAATEEGVYQLLRRHTELAKKREEISMFLAEARGKTLYSLGQIFLVTSIAAPLAAGFVYLLAEPLTPETVVRVKELKEAVGELPKGVTVAVQRDWRILLGGVSFGFLMLAAAAGLLRQQRREIQIYFRQSERVNDFQRLLSVLEIKEKLAPDGEAEGAVVDLVVERLLETSDSPEAEGEGDDGELDPKAAMDLVKAVRGVSG